MLNREKARAGIKLNSGSVRAFNGDQNTLTINKLKSAKIIMYKNTHNETKIKEEMHLCKNVQSLNIMCICHFSFAI